MWPGFNGQSTITRATSTISTTPTDADFASVDLLCHFDGSDGGTTFTDSSANNVSGTGSSGFVELDTSQSKWGTASLAMGPTAGLPVTWTGSRFNRALGVAATIEVWFRVDNTGAVVSFFTAGSGGSGPEVYYGDSWPGEIVIQPGSGSDIHATAGANTWHFLQLITSTANVLTAYLNNTLIGTRNSQPAWTGSVFELNANGALIATNNGWLDDLRVTVGVARANAVPTEAFPDS